MDNAAGNRSLRDITRTFPAGENLIRRTRRESLRHYVDCQPDNIDNERQVDIIMTANVVPFPRSIKLN